MGFKIKRLNLDTSWEIHWDDLRIVIDPWLVGSEVDYFSWFNEQWHTKEPVHPDDIESPDIILISQGYSDHCHEETLRHFPESTPILASPHAYRRLIKSFPKERLIQLPILSKEGYLAYDGLEIATIDPGRKLDPIYYAHVLKKDDKSIFYSSHGFEFSPIQKENLGKIHIDVLMTSFSRIKLPSLLGGAVNPGIENVHYLLDQLNPRIVLNTHDEPKKHKGIVMKMATATYPDYTSISFPNSKFINIEDYNFLDVNA